MKLFDFLTQTSYSFEGKKDNENVALFVHRHSFTLLDKVIPLILFGLAPLVIFVVFGQFIVGNGMMIIFLCLWSVLILFLWYLLFYSITLYMLDYWIITDQRIINSELVGFFDREISEVSIYMIQDVSVKIEGLMATTLDYGTVEVQTAAKENHFLFEEVPNPQKIKDTIVNMIGVAEQRRETKTAPIMSAASETESSVSENVIVPNQDEAFM